MSFLQDITTTLIFYIVLSVSHLGLGWIVSQLLSLQFRRSERLFSHIWLGWAVTLLLLQTINLVFAINAIVSILLLLFGMASSCIFLWREYRTGNIFQVPRAWLVLTVLVAAWIATVSMQAPRAYDSGLYHFNSIRWLNEFPIVLGLGNLHGRLAYNQSILVYVAHLNLYPYFNHGHNIANGFLLFLLLAEGLLHITRKTTEQDSVFDLSAGNLLWIFFIPVIAYLVPISEISSPKPDTASSILQILVFIYFARALQEISDSSESNANLYLVFILSATAITVKLSNIVYVLTICILLLAVEARARRFSLKETLARAIKISTLPAWIAITWCTRGLLLSGCPVYPSTIGCINSSWSVPIKFVREEAAWIYSWARMPRETPDKVLNSWDWLAPWFNQSILTNKLTTIYPLALTALWAAAMTILYIRSRRKIAIDKNIFFLPVPIVTGLLFWFFTAPDVRFVLSLFLLMPVTAAIMLLNVIDPNGKAKYWLVTVLFVILNAGMAWSALKNPQTFPKISTAGYEPIRTVRLIQHTTRSGLEVWSPAREDQCWDSELPCTPYFRETLEFVDRPVFPEFRVGTDKQFSTNTKPFFDACHQLERLTWKVHRQAI